jgi:methylphosphotriester-DNA--protein-cysteine methyltransferase
MRRLDISKAKTILMSHLNHITGITKWAKLMGYNRIEFSRYFKKTHDMSPKKMFHRVRVDSIMVYLAQHPHAKHYEVAIRFGLRDEKALYDYLKYHHDASPTEVKAFSLESAWERRRR